MHLIEENRGNQNELMDQNNNCEGESNMELSSIQKLFQEVEVYKQAIEDAKDALASVEQELDETLAADYYE